MQLDWVNAIHFARPVIEEARNLSVRKVNECICACRMGPKPDEEAHDATSTAAFAAG